jgi:hypothetical protein
VAKKVLALRRVQPHLGNWNSELRSNSSAQKPNLPIFAMHPISTRHTGSLAATGRWPTMRLSAVQLTKAAIHAHCKISADF